MTIGLFLKAVALTTYICAATRTRALDVLKPHLLKPHIEVDLQDLAYTKGLSALQITSHNTTWATGSAGAMEAGFVVSGAGDGRVNGKYAPIGGGFGTDTGHPTYRPLTKTGERDMKSSEIYKQGEEWIIRHAGSHGSLYHGQGQTPDTVSWLVGPYGKTPIPSVEAASVEAADAAPAGKAQDEQEQQESRAPNNPDKLVEHHMDKAETTAKKDAERMERKVESAPEELPGEVAKDEKMLRGTFMPGMDWSTRYRSLLANFYGVIFVSLWFFFYFTYYVQTDRGDDMCCSAAEAAAVFKPDEKTGVLFGWLDNERFLRKDVKADMVIVFHKSTHEKHESSGSKERNRDYFDHIMLGHVGEEVKFENWRKLFGDKFDLEDLTQSRRASEVLEADPEEHGPVMVKDAREALLTDIFECLGKFGFNVQVFSSVDDDEIFLCISLEDKWVEHYLTRQQWELKFRPSFVEKLGIGECTDMDALEPPAETYDGAMVQRLSESGFVEGSSCPAKMVYMTYTSPGVEGGELLSGANRFRVIYKALAAHFDLDRAKMLDVVVDWYPTHRLQWLQRISLTWARYATLFDFHFRQPIKLIQEYFGARIAFILAWNGVYCKAFLGLVPVAIIWEIGAYLFATYGGWEGARRQVMAFCLIIILWSRIAFNLWEREQEFFMRMWGMDTHMDLCETQRPEFEGERMPADSDSNIEDVVAPKWSQTVKSTISFSIVGVLILLVMAAVYLWMMIFDGNLGLTGQILLTIQIKVFELIFNVIAAKLTNWENHKYPAGHYNSLLWKQFMFLFVNSYYAFFYLAIKQRYTNAGCPAGGCLAALRQQLVITVVILSVCRIFEVFLGSVMVQIKIWLEDRELRATLEEGKELPKRSYVEEQAKYLEFGAQEQIQMMLQSIIPLGYVLLFGGVAPIIIPFAFAVFAVQLRATAFVLVSATKRPLPRRLPGIGAWRDVVSWLMNIGVAFAGFLLMSYGHILEGQTLITKLTVILLFYAGVGLLFRAIDICVPPHDEATDIMSSRRNRIRTLLAKKIAEADDRAERLRGARGCEDIKADQATTVRDKDWNAIARLRDVPDGSSCLQVTDLTFNAEASNFPAEEPASVARESYALQRMSRDKNDP